LALRVFACVCCAPSGVAKGSPARSYHFYEPTVTHHTIAKCAVAPGHLGDNHMASLEWFNGKFYCAWSGNLDGIGEGGLNVLSTSEDFVRWTPYEHFCGRGSVNPLPFHNRKTGEGQGQPNLLNYRNKELWCLHFGSVATKARSLTYLSTLSKEPGAKWLNRAIVHRHHVFGRYSAICFPSQNPFLCRSGRVVAPVTLYCRAPDRPRRRQWNAVLYTDDGGKTWQISNPVSMVEDYYAQWEPAVHEQADGRLRMFMRNFTKATPPGTQWQLTTTGTGAKKGEPVVFDPDPRYSWMETANSRMQVFRVRGGRYCMVHHDVHVLHRDYTTRLNLALFFSRSGRDDFVASVPISRRNVISSYPQGIEHDGKVYVVYTFGPGGHRGIEGAIIDPAPAPGRFYIWPREKHRLRMEARKDAQGKQRIVRANPDVFTHRPSLAERDGRQAILFKRSASAGVETDPVYFEEGQSLTLCLDAKALAVQDRGSLILCSFGDRTPIRIGVPSARSGTLYAYGADEWRPVGPMPIGEWCSFTITFGPETFSVQIGDRAAKSFPNPMRKMTPRLYLGDGYDVDYVASNRGSEFLIDLKSVTTQVK